MKTAFVIGNGPSREAIDLYSLKGVTWGCNALYRDYAPDYLVAVDPMMQREILSANYHETHKVVFKRTKAYDFTPHPNITEWRPAKGAPNNSGTTAVYYATTHGARRVFLLGFDISKENVYDGTNCYNPKRYMKLFPSNWKVIVDWQQRNSSLEIIRVINPEICHTPPELKVLKHITIDEFKRVHTNQPNGDQEH